MVSVVRVRRIYTTIAIDPRRPDRYDQPGVYARDLVDVVTLTVTEKHVMYKRKTKLHRTLDRPATSHVPL